MKKRFFFLQPDHVKAILDSAPENVKNEVERLFGVSQLLTLF